MATNATDVADATAEVIMKMATDVADATAEVIMKMAANAVARAVARTRKQGPYTSDTR